MPIDMARRAPFRFGTVVIAATAVLTGPGVIRDAAAQVQSAPAPSLAAVAAPAIPGTDPGVQRWLKGIEAARIAFNNQLLKAEQDIAAGLGTANCSALANTIKLVNAALPALRALPNGGAKLAAAYANPLQQFGNVAALCIAGDFAGARVALGDTTTGAIASYGEAQALVDEILEGEA